MRFEAALIEQSHQARFTLEESGLNWLSARCRGAR